MSNIGSNSHRPSVTHTPSDRTSSADSGSLGINSGDQQPFVADDVEDTSSVAFITPGSVNDRYSARTQRTNPSLLGTGTDPAADGGQHQPVAPSGTSLSPSRLAAELAFWDNTGDQELADLTYAALDILQRAGIQDHMINRTLTHTLQDNQYKMDTDGIAANKAALDKKATAAAIKCGIAIGAAFASGAMAAGGGSNSGFGRAVGGASQAVGQAINAAGDAGLKSKGGAERQGEELDIQAKEYAAAKENMQSVVDELNDSAKSIIEEIQQARQLLKQHYEMETEKTRNALR